MAGSRNKASLILDRIASSEAQEVLRSIIQQAKAGDVEAAKILLSRIWPPRRGRPLPFELPDGASISEISATVLNAVAAGTLSPEEGQAVAAVVETHRRALELDDIQKRLLALEANSNEHR